MPPVMKAASKGSAAGEGIQQGIDEGVGHWVEVLAHHQVGFGAGLVDAAQLG